MAKKDIKRRFITLELNPNMSDCEELAFKEWVADGLRKMKLHGNNALLTLPKVALRTQFENESDIVVVNKKILIPK